MRLSFKVDVCAIFCEESHRKVQNVKTAVRQAQKTKVTEFPTN